MMTLKKIRLTTLFLLAQVLSVSEYSGLYAQAAYDGEYAVTVTARQGGKIIAPDKSEVTGGSTAVYYFSESCSAEFRFEPDMSKILSDVIVDSFSAGPPDNASYTFSSIDDNHEIIGVFSDADMFFPDSAGDDRIFTETDLNQSYRDMIDRGISYTSPVVSVDNSNGTQNGDEIYMTFFRPMENGQWQGNLKKYGIELIARPECEGRESPELTIVDKYGDAAVDCDGAFLETSISYWSEINDGGFASKGGAGQLLLDLLIDIDSSTEVNQYHSIRNIKTYLDDPAGSLVSFNRNNITKSILDVEDDAAHDKVINYIYGYSHEADSEGRPMKKREWVLGDIVHSEPKIMEYYDPSTEDLKYRYIAVGSNDGMLHVFTDTSIFFGGKTYSPGEEIFAFIPTDLLHGLKEIAVSASTRDHMVDGSPNLFYHGTTDSSGYFHKTLVFGERRGGRNYWALDVTNPDPSTWTFMWHIAGSAGGVTTPLTRHINELGYTWNKPYFSVLKISEYINKNIMIFAGGYCPVEDGFPEPFIDNNNNGARDTGEAHAATAGGTEGYDKFNPSIDRMGRGIFVVDMDDGSLLFKVVYSEGPDKTTGAAQTLNAMRYCFPADASVISFSESRLLIYAADIYGQVWKIKYDYYADILHSFDSDLSSRWTVKCIFKANPGSDLVSGSGIDLVTPFTDEDPDTPGFNNADQGRKTFYSPDISYYGNEWTRRPVLYFGTGDRAHPHYAMISNRFYAVADTDALTYETDLLNLTCNELDINADADNDGEENDTAEDKSLQRDLKELLSNNKVKGFYRVLNEQGACAGCTTEHHGEHILSQPIVFAGNIYFTSYQPNIGNSLNPGGNIFSYAFDYSFGTSKLNNDSGVENDYDSRKSEDTFSKIDNTAVASGMQVITKKSEAFGLISTGGNISSIAEDPAIEIPAAPGGISQMLWEIE